jgi:hypothetical protein
MAVFSVVYRVGEANGRGSIVLVCNIAINDAMQFMKAVNQGRHGRAGRRQCHRVRPSLERQNTTQGRSTFSRTSSVRTPVAALRFPFIAIAEIAYRESEEGLSCRVITLSLHRCYVDMPNTLPIGREVSIKTFAESECFAATAKVIYELAKLGDRTCVRGSIVKEPSAFT